MSRSALKSFAVFFPAWLWIFCLIAQVTSGQSLSPAMGQTQDEFLEYRLRRGESLDDVAQLFRIPVAELTQLNNITDPTRLQINQALKIPNAFARQVMAFREERDRLLAEKELLTQQLREQQQLLATQEQVLRKTEVDKEMLAQQLASVGQWRLGAQVLSLVLLGVLIWGLLLNKDRARRGRQIATFTQQNIALDVAKEKYRLAAAQLEFRYQKLYSGRSEKPSQLATEGATLLTQTFATGCVQLEQCLSAIKTEREKAEHLQQAEQKIFDLLRHPFREFQHWYRLRYHGA